MHWGKTEPKEPTLDPSIKRKKSDLMLLFDLTYLVNYSRAIKWSSPTQASDATQTFPGFGTWGGSIVPEICHQQSRPRFSPSTYCMRIWFFHNMMTAMIIVACHFYFLLQQSVGSVTGPHFPQTRRQAKVWALSVDTFVSKHTVGSNGCVRKLDDGRMDGGWVKL